jgi:hypothetical protein
MRQVPHQGGNYHGWVFDLLELWGEQMRLICNLKKARNRGLFYNYA